MFSSISSTYADSSLESVGSVWRLKGPSKTLPQIKTERLSKAPGKCPKGSSLALILAFENQKAAEDWINVELFSKGPCDISAYPTNDAFEVRFSYPQKKFGGISTISYETQSGFVIDHWYEGVNKNKKTKVSKKRKKFKRILNPLLGIEDTLKGIYEDQESWERILGKEGRAYSFDTPELERFRTERKAKFDRLNQEVLRQVPLKVPMLPLPYLDAQINFKEKPFVLGAFEERSIVAPKGKKFTEREVKIVVKGLNYVRQKIKKKEWLEAREAIRVLERGKQKELLPTKLAMWWALKGYVTIQLGLKLNKREIKARGLDFWRDGLRKTAGRGGAEQAWADFMALESLRILFDENKFYAAAATLAWVQKYRWSPETEERLAFLRAEVHYRLGLFDESYALFDEFVEARRQLPVSAAFDRRVLPIAFFRLGDVRLLQGKYKESIQLYSSALSKMPSLEKVSFEGAWYPAELRFYPQALYHRAEAALRLGKERSALADLRAFSNFSLDHPNSSLVLFRIGDLLESMGAEDEKIDGTWRECLFRSSEGIGSRLCAARQAARLIKTSDPILWPRLIATIEDIVNANNLDRFSTEFKEDLDVYRRVVLADAFLDRDSPYQAYQQLEKSRVSYGSEKLMLWAREYQVSALAGYLGKRIRVKRYREAIDIYTSARDRRLLDMYRPEVQWPLIQAYKKLGILSLASEQLDIAWPYLDSKEPNKTRLYLPSRSEWAGLRLELITAVYSKNKKRKSAVRDALKEFKKRGASERDLLRAQIKIDEIEENKNQEIKHWERLRRVDVLTWGDVTRFANLLHATAKYEKELEVLNRNVGGWLSVRKKLRPQPAPNVALVFSLFEARERAGEWGPAFATLSYLMSLSDGEYGNILTRAQLFYRQGNLHKEMGRKADARQSFESAKGMAPESVWGQLSDGELGTL